ncbi:hypothetical protein LIA77_07225 [Sarocladium implicatum]|nr:hypothetical protein LIA77_07225 [Sarocladium implicatum]
MPAALSRRQIKGSTEHYRSTIDRVWGCVLPIDPSMRGRTRAQQHAHTAVYQFPSSDALVPKSCRVATTTILARGTLYIVLRTYVSHACLCCAVMTPHAGVDLGTAR